ncbi:MAG TPA: portal protein [Candidatus Diapherotrites archaeon]|nr:portal protein [Candidatus Diapherotrites archaeon]
MSGFTLRSLDNKNTGFLKNIQRNIRYLSSLGMKWDDKITKQSKSIGIAESQMDSMYDLYYQGNYKGTDYDQKEFIAFYDKEYPTRRDFLRKFAMNGEIEYVIEVIADESIIYDNNNYFAYPDTKNLKNVLKQDKAKEIVDDINESFKKVYFAFGFNQGHDAWHYFKKFLIDGFLAFEIIYDGEGEEDAKNIIGFKEIDPISLEPEIRTDSDGNEYRVWVQYEGDSKKQRELLDANIIYISWARGNFISRLSYVERLVRSFNLLRTLENSRIIWNVWNSQMRIKILVPIGSQSEVKAQTRLSKLRGMYKEELNIDDQSGEVTYNGSPKFNFAKTFVIPTRAGETTEINGFQAEGYDLSNTEALKYFWLRYIIETKVPLSRFSHQLTGESGSSNWGAGSESANRDEIRFSYFINRIRSIFQEILLKPLWLQFVLKHPEFQKDFSLRSAIGLKFNEENLFKLMKIREIADKGSSIVNNLMNIKEPIVNPDGTIGESTYFDPKFLIEKYMDFTDEDIKFNEKLKKQRRDNINKLIQAYSRLNDLKGENEGGESGGFNFGGEFGEGEIGGGGEEFGGGEETGGGEEL